MARLVLTKVLRRKELSKRQFAKLMKKPYFTVFRYFRDGYNPTFATLNDMAKALKCKVRDLLEE